MRDLVIFGVVFAILPFAFRRPHIAILLWTWLGIMNPHRLTWGPAFDFPFAALTAFVLIIGLIFSTGEKKLPIYGTVILLLIFALWMTVTSVFAIFPEVAWEQWKKVMKILLVTFFIMMVMKSRSRLTLLIWVVILSLGFFGTKGGIFAVATGGEYLVLGPAGSFIQGNNEMALALIMALPLMRCIQMISGDTRVWWLMSIMILFSIVSIAASYSRGALLALAGMSLFLWLKSHNRAVIGMLMILGAVMTLALMPDKWFARMDTIDDYQADASAMGRIYVWQYAINVANDRILTGGGFGAFNRSLHAVYAPPTDEPDTYIATDAHSIYFKVLGEHGYIGLIIFLALLASAFGACGKAAKNARDNPKLDWAVSLARMLQVCIVGYALGGAFLGLAYFDLFYTIVACAVCLRWVTENADHESDESAQPNKLMAA